MAAWGSTHTSSKSFSLSEIMNDEMAASNRSRSFKNDGISKRSTQNPSFSKVINPSNRRKEDISKVSFQGQAQQQMSSPPMNNVEKFQRDGFLIVPNVLNESQCNSIKQIIDTLDSKGGGKGGGGKGGGKRNQPGRHQVHKCLFETYPEECLDIFKNETILSIVKNLLSMAGTSRSGGDRSHIAHVIHNNAFKVSPGGYGQASKWHTDDAPLFIGELPPDVHIAPITLTCMYYLNDIREGSIDGMTHIIPKSHRFGRPCTDEEASTMNYIAPSVSKGTCLIISSALWHKGSSVDLINGNPRYLFQVSYGRRLVGHKFKSIMDYHLPLKVKNLLITDEDKELMGYLQGGAYS